MRKSTNLERRLRILEGRFATLDPSITGDFSLADAHTEAEMAVETSQRVARTLFWGSSALLAGSMTFAAVSALLS